MLLLTNTSSAWLPVHAPSAVVAPRLHSGPQPRTRSDPQPSATSTSYAPNRCAWAVRGNDVAPPRRNKGQSRQAVVTRVASAPAPASASTSAPPPAPPHPTTASPPPPYLDPRAGIRDTSGRLLLKNLTLAELTDWCESVGDRAPARRSQQLYRWLYGKGRWMRRLDEADTQSSAFSKEFKAKVAAGASLSGGVTLQSVTTARDGTCKLVFALNEGEGSASGSVETVLIPMWRPDGSVRYTACLSTQVGCAQNCQFCYTGRMGLLGNLSTAQIVEQVVEARRWLAQRDDGEGSGAGGAGARTIGNIVFMGMGEPLHNYGPVMAAIDVLAEGLLLSRAKIIVSTVGLLPQVRAFLATGKAKLAVSLHATTDEVRDWIVPTNRRYPLGELLGLLEEEFPAYAGEGERRAPVRGDKFVIIEYLMLRGVNDTAEDAARLAALLRDVYCMVNLIPFNPHEGTQFQRSEDADVRRFREVLAAAGKVCTIRATKGDDSMAACGQLGDLAMAARPAPLLPAPARLQALMDSRAGGR